ncbi:MAG TPA: hypothetical protein DHM42_05035 [Clostridiales bacterium]|nr:hypothetical protein [Clostridiales bacterium]
MKPIEKDYDKEDLTIDDVKEIIGNRIKVAIKTSMKTYRDVAKNIDMSYSYISDVANGKYLPSIQTITKLCNYLEVEVSEIVGGYEYWIHPKGLNFDKKELSEQELESYYSALSDVTSWLTPKNRKLIGKQNRDGGINNIVKVKESIQRAEINDNSMNLLGIYKDDVVTYNDKNIDAPDSIENGKIYLVKIKSEHSHILRKVFKSKDELILIPCSQSSNYQVVSIDFEEIEWIKRAIMITKML